MSAPVRFLFVAVAGWTLFRGATLGFCPAADAFTIARAEAAPAPAVSAIVPTEFPPIAPRRSPIPPRWRRVTRSYGDYPPPPPVPPRYAAAPGLLLSRSRRARGASRSRFRRLNRQAPNRSSRQNSTRRFRSWSNGTLRRSRAARCPRRHGRARPFPSASRPSSRKSISTGCSSAPGRCARSDGRHRLARQRRDARREPGRRPADLRIRSPDRRLAALESAVGGSRGGEVAAGVRVHADPVDPGLDHRRTAPGDRQVQHRPLRLRSVRRRRASTTGRSAGTSCSTAMPRPASSGSAAATCSPTAG